MPTSVSTRSSGSVHHDRRNEQRPRRLGDQVAGRLVLVVAAAWVVGLGWLFAVTPQADPAATPSMLDAVVQTTMLLSWMGVIFGLAARQRWGLVVSGVAGAVLLGAGMLCLVTGHTGAWIAIQIGVGMGLVGISYLATRLA